jgi:hypothetical protein
MPCLRPTHHETSKHDYPNETKIKEKQNKTISGSNSNLTKSMTHHNQTNELTTWFLMNTRGTQRYSLPTGKCYHIQTCRRYVQPLRLVLAPILMQLSHSVRYNQTSAADSSYTWLSRPSQSKGSGAPTRIWCSRYRPKRGVRQPYAIAMPERT